jgi:hypothetical protein
MSCIKDNILLGYTGFHLGIDGKNPGDVQHPQGFCGFVAESDG